MAKPTWSSRADALLAWVAGDVWRYEKQLREGIPQRLMINSTQLLERVGEFLNASNQLEPFYISIGFKVEAIRWHAKDKNIQWKESQGVERPSWLSEHVLKGQFGEIGLEALHDSTLRLRRVLQDRESAKTQGKELARNPRETRPQERERGKAQVMDEAQRTILWRKEEEKIRELQFRREVKRHGYTKDPEFPGNLSWTDHNASGFIYREPPNQLGRGIRRGGQDVYLTSPLPLTGPSTIRR
ncbi:hypothetical protein BCIN_08g00430 [Botrytis cinerea B05.10]|uniref:Uncharacterized protein n=3 Tax=Botryotinia fuckeliana TaxID=40559 RepID=A0A384JP41_BOTFB|nr:hypothetical protein BCIN_08g00430 [Botrytis cinerea B05.10]ATZ52280.1 hypothetical protein BCIN_08g00430 [Botrytis cinerea B05.10]EMR85467.1 hypothetical protein BcDW1_5905 [Botrytis cinerea BcDW1]CCD43867.1 hypothetical protein BofuT4_P011150.1 [Botrytis cinerea T4]